MANDSVKVNAKGFSRYLLGCICPRKFGNPYHMKAVLTDEVGNVKLVMKVWNTVTTAGDNGIADQILATPTLGKPTHMAVGTGTGGTTALNVENDRNALTSKTRANAVVTMVGSWAAGEATAALTEAGIFTAASGGDMWTYTTFAVINKGASDTLQITWTITIS
ncbi:MAG: hypothetical protein PHW24_03170 [Candidatus Moranbacteria bacterium]|nr:hypothetical protein [Candidatus Moranbacteria bacterium]